MPKEVWGTFSVKDHLVPGAFVRELLLFDRLVVPVPPDESEVARWSAPEQNWNPQRQRMLLNAIPNNRKREVEWDHVMRERWDSRHKAVNALARDAEWAFTATAAEMLAGLPKDVTGVQGVATFQGYDGIPADINLRERQPGDAVTGAAVCVLGWEFLVPNDEGASELDQLKRAVELSSGNEASRKRRSLWRWTREFLAEHHRFPDADKEAPALREAIDEMAELLEDEREIARKSRLKVRTQFAFMIATVGVGIAAGPLTPLAATGAFLSIGQFVAEKLMDSPDYEPRPPALIVDARKHFGWE